ncbi:MAG TPA: carboxypeptidase-like regulatory domain-containing protein [Pyrinomonadaceae bacterium]|nr:carboxypeptidase-like regulatory domain-containing protein [Pyrinomonadaceae bacterium]
MQRAVMAAGLIIFAVMASFSQTETARIQGTVFDQKGAILPGAAIKVTSKSAGKTFDVNGGANGSFVLSGLQPGQYLIEAKVNGFKVTKQEITLNVAQVLELNFYLEPGEVTETVNVTTDTGQIDTATSAVGEVIDGREAVELPLNGRNVLELARLTPGVTQGVPDGFATGVSGNAETYRGRNTGGAALSINGQRTQANNFLLDGVDNNESLVNTINVFPSAEAVQEFRVQTSVAPAEFGRGGGGIVNSVIKSGKNNFYSSAFIFIRNDNFDARPTFNSTKNEFRRGQFGGTFGGPIIRDRLFFFGDYEGLRQFLPLNQETATVPTAKMRTGDFSELLTLPNPIQLIDILTNSPIPGNRVDLLPGNRMNNVGLNYLKAFPLPNRPGVFSNYVTTRNETTQTDTYDVRIDSNLTTKNQLFGRISQGFFDQTVSSRLPNLPAGFGSGTNPIRTRGFVVGLNTAFSGSFFNELRIQANRIKYGYTPPFFDKTISADLGIPNANRDPSLGGGALIGGYNGQLEYTGDFGPYIVPQDTYQIVDGISFNRGSHTIKIGGTILRRDVALYRPNRGKGYFFLIGNGDPSQCGGAPSTGWEQADLLIGFVCNYQIGPPFGFVGTRNWENAAFIQDDWRASSRLTINLGLRYEYFTNPTEMYGRQANFDLKTGKLILAKGSGDSLTETDRNNFGPRIGFAYDISGKGKDVIRGGYGLFYFLDRGGIDNQLAQNPPYSGFSQFNFTDGVRITLSGRAPNNTLDSRLATGPLPLGSVSSVNLDDPRNVAVLAWKPDNKTSNVHQFNIQYQRQLTRDTALSVGYIGTRGRNLILYYNLNGRVIQPGTNVPCPNGTSTAPCYPTLAGNPVKVRDDIGESQYDALQVQLERRFSRGWQYRIAYSLSKTKDNGEGAFDAVADTNINFIEPLATSRVDFPQVLSLESVYDIPFGRGRRFGSDIPKALDTLIGGWQINGIYRVSSGQPFDVRVNGVRVDLIGEPYTGDTEPYLVRSAFTPAPSGRFGTLERNSLRGPILNQMNLGLTKNFVIYESWKIQFRTEFFNLFNTPQLTPPNTDYFNTDPVFGFGRIRSTYGFTNRQIQFGLRMEF